MSQTEANAVECPEDVNHSRCVPQGKRGDRSVEELRCSLRHHSGVVSKGGNIAGSGLNGKRGDRGRVL